MARQVSRRRDSEDALIGQVARHRREPRWWAEAQGLDRAWAALLRGFDRGTLTANFAGTVERMMFGWLIASAVGVALGAAIGSNSVRRRRRISGIRASRAGRAVAVGRPRG